MPSLVVLRSTSRRVGPTPRANACPRHLRGHSVLAEEGDAILDNADERTEQAVLRPWSSVADPG